MIVFLLEIKKINLNTYFWETVNLKETIKYKQIQLTHEYGNVLKEVDFWSLRNSGEEKYYLNCRS